VSYRVFARKYRPQTFEEVVGQDHITRTLQNAIHEERVAQAYMFVGPRGIGKTSTARILAKALNCEEGPTATPCGKCAACMEIAEGRNLDVIEIDGASNNGVENIRDLRESAAYAPARGPFKIYIIDEVHMLSTGAFNALLKTLEEPPAHVKFIFATTEAQKVPATITSRCQRFDLRRIPTEAIAGHLGKIAGAEKIHLETEAAEAIARAAEGGLRDAESMLDQAVAFCGDTITRSGVMDIFGFTPRETVCGLVDALLEQDTTTALEIISAQDLSGKDLSRLLDDVTAHLRDLLVRGVSSDSAARREQLLALLDHFAETEARMRWAPDKKLQFDVAVIKAVHLLGQASLDEVLETLAALREGSDPPDRARRAATFHPAPPPRSAQTAPPSPTPQKPQQTSQSAAKAATKPGTQTAPPSGGAAPPTPAPPPAVRRPPSDTPERIEDSIAWERVAADFRTSFVSHFVADGIFASGDARTILIHFHPSLQDELESMLGERARKEAEGKLAEVLGRKVSLQFKVVEGLPDPEYAGEQEGEEPEPQPVAPAKTPDNAPHGDPAPTPPPPKPGKPTTTNPKDDPLIQEALKIFKAEIQQS
jgi:DNA polymerase III subunit gamma/tau